MDEFDYEDLDSLLEKELEGLGSSDENENYEDDLAIFQQTLDKHGIIPESETNPENDNAEWELLLQSSSNVMAVLSQINEESNKSRNQSDIVKISETDQNYKIDIKSLVNQNTNKSDQINLTTELQSNNSEELTNIATNDQKLNIAQLNEDKPVEKRDYPEINIEELKSLMNQMIESVECSAPLFSLSNKTLTFENDENTEDLEFVHLVIIDEEAEIKLQKNMNFKNDLPNNKTIIADILSDLSKTTKSRYEDAKLVQQQEDEMAIRMEVEELQLAIEQDRKLRKERQIKRERERENARREACVLRIQCGFRCYQARKLYKKKFDQLNQKLLEKAEFERVKGLQNLENERKNMFQVANEQIKVNQSWREIEMLLKEIQLMNSAELQCKSIWNKLEEILSFERNCMGEWDVLSEKMNKIWKEERKTLELKKKQDEIELERLKYAQSLDLEAEEEYEDFVYTSDEDEGFNPQPAEEYMGETRKPPFNLTSAQDQEKRELQHKQRQLKNSTSQVQQIQQQQWGGLIDTSNWATPAENLPEPSVADPDDIDVEMDLNEIPMVYARNVQVRTADETLAEDNKCLKEWSEFAQQALNNSKIQIKFNKTGVQAARESLAEGKREANLEEEEEEDDLLLAWRAWCDWKNGIPELRISEITIPITEGDMGFNEEEDKNPGEVELNPNQPFERWEGPELQTDPTKVVKLDFCVEGIVSLEFLKKYKGLKELSLNVNKISSFSCLKGLKELNFLSAKDNRIIDIKDLKSLKTLKTLYLDSNRISDILPFTGMTSLVTLTLNTNSISEFKPFFCENLQRLELSGNKISGIFKGVLEFLPSLTHLDLSSNVLQYIDGESLSRCSLLQTLILSNNKLTQVPSPLRLPLLKTLWLGGNEITDLSLWKSESIYPLYLPTLQKLILRDNQIKTLEKSIFSCGIPLLEELDLSFNGIGSHEDLLHLRECQMLRSLQIQDNPVTIVTSGPTGTGGAITGIQLEKFICWVLQLIPTLETLSGSNILLKDYLPKLKKYCSVKLIQRVMKRKGRNGFNTGNCWENRQFGRFFRDSKSSLLKRYIQLLRVFSTDCVGFSNREKILKREALKNKNKSETNNLDKIVDWENEWVNLLRQQCDKLLQFDELKSIDRTIFTSFLKNKEEKETNKIIIKIDSIPTTIINEQNLTTIKQNNINSENTEIPTFENTENLNKNAIKIQKLYKGYIIRKKINIAFRSIKYEDKELDDLLSLDQGFKEVFGEDGGFLDGLLDDIGSDFQFNGNYGKSKVVNNDNFSNENEEVGNDNATMVYGDHIRKRRRASKENLLTTTNEDNSLSINTNTNRNNWIGNKNSENPQRINEDAGTGLVGLQPNPPTTPRPSSTMSTASEPRSEASSIYDGQMDMSGHSDGHSEMSPALSTGRRGKNIAQAAEEWGISDPKVLAAMMKRNKRLTSFEKAKEVREREKDPQARYQKFLKNVQKHGNSSNGSCHGNTATSGSFGGKPKTLRAAATKKKIPLPAWMLGEQDEG